MMKYRLCFMCLLWVVTAAESEERPDEPATAGGTNVLHFAGYDVVLLAHDYVPVRMHSPPMMTPPSADGSMAAPERLLDKLSLSRAAGGPSFSLVPQSSVARPPGVSLGGEETSSLLQGDDFMSGIDAEADSLSGWGWLADEVLSAKRSRQMGLSERALFMDSFLGDAPLADESDTMPGIGGSDDALGRGYFDGESGVFGITERRFGNSGQKRTGLSGVWQFPQW